MACAKTYKFFYIWSEGVTAYWVNKKINLGISTGFLGFKGEWHQDGKGKKYTFHKLVFRDAGEHRIW